MVIALVILIAMAVGFRRFARAILLTAFIGACMFYVTGQIAIDHSAQMTGELAKTNPEQAQAFTDLERMDAERDAKWAAEDNHVGASR